MFFSGLPVAARRRRFAPSGRAFGKAGCLGVEGFAAWVQALG